MTNKYYVHDIPFHYFKCKRDKLGKLFLTSVIKKKKPLNDIISCHTEEQMHVNIHDGKCHRKYIENNCDVKTVVENWLLTSAVPCF